MTSTDSNKQKSSTNVKKEYIQKLSNDKALAEAIIIGKKPWLIIIDFTNPYNINTKLLESLAINEETRYYPELLNNRPYSFKSKEEFDAYVERAKHETLDSLFDKVLVQWRRYIDADENHLKLCAGDTMFTYKQDVLGMTHYLFFVADNDAGKSNNLKLLNILAYRNLMTTNMTHANVYNFLGGKEEGVGTICIDEADNLDEYPELMSIVKSGYTKGFPVVRIIDTPHGRKQLRLYTYCFKAFAGERLPDAIEARGFMQRTIVLKCLPGFRKDDISEVTDPSGDEEYQEQLTELNDLRNLLFCYFRVVHFNDKVPNIKLNIRNREKQLFKPLLKMFQDTRSFETLRPVISEYIKERRREKANSYHAFLYRIIRDLTKQRGILELESNDIWNFVKTNVLYKDIPYKPQSIETVEFGILSQKSVTSTLKDVFRAKLPGHKGSTRKLIFSQDVLNRMKDTYDMDFEIEVDFETQTFDKDFKDEDEDENGAHGAHGAHSGGTDTGPTSDDSDDTEDNHNEEQNNENSHEQDTESNENDGLEPDTGALSEYVPQAPQAPQTDLDPDLAKVGERLSNLRQAVDNMDKAWKSKASEAAEANLSGEGVMDYH